MYILREQELPIKGKVLDYNWGKEGDFLLVSSLSAEKPDIVLVEQIDITKHEANTKKLAEIPLMDIAFSGKLYDKKRFLGVAVNETEKLIAYGGQKITFLRLDKNYGVLSQLYIRLSLYDERYGMPVWSPDGKKLIVVNYIKDELDGIRKYLKMFDVNGRQTNLIYDGDVDWDYYPCWSPLGESLTFSDGRKIFVIDKNLNVSFVTKGKNPSWSPVEARILYEAVDTREIYLIDIDGRNKRLLKKPAHSPSWDPTGRKVVYVSGGIEISDTLGKNQKMLSRNGERPIWSNSGEKVAFLNGEETIKIQHLAKQAKFKYLYTFNMGGNDGIRTGMVLDVYKTKQGLVGQTIGYDKNNWRGRIYVTKVNPAYSVAENLTGEGINIFESENMVVHPEGKKYGFLTSSIVKQ